MTESLEAQAKELVANCGQDHNRRGACVECIVSLTRHLIAESRAGALREVIDVAAATDDDLILDALEALAAEAEPGAQGRAGKGGK